MRSSWQPVTAPPKSARARMPASPFLVERDPCGALGIPSASRSHTIVFAIVIAEESFGRVIPESCPFLPEIILISARDTILPRVCGHEIFAPAVQSSRAGTVHIPEPSFACRVDRAPKLRLHQWLPAPLCRGVHQGSTTAPIHGTAEAPHSRIGWLGNFSAGLRASQCHVIP